MMKRIVSSVVMVTLLISNGRLLAQQADTVPRSRDYWYSYAGKLPIGSTVRVRTADGRRLTAVLAVVDQESITLETRTRIPEPPRRIPFDQLVQLELRKNGSSVGKSIAVGAAVGAGTFLGILMILMAAAWD
jgi:hypothetical protein